MDTTPGSPGSDPSPFAVVFEHCKAVTLLVDPDSGAFVELNADPLTFNGHPGGRHQPMVFHEIEESSVGAVREDLPDTETVKVLKDERLLRESVAELLARRTLTTMMAGSGDGASELYRCHAVEVLLILSDSGLPSYGGEGLFRRRRGIGSWVPIMAMSGLLVVGQKERCSELGSGRSS